MPRSDALRTDSPFLQIVYRYADELGIPRSVAASLIQQESGWQAQARAGTTSAVGLGQLTRPVYEGEFGMTEQQAMEPENNIRASLQYLKRQMDAFDGDLELGLHAYHNGSAYTTRGEDSPAGNPHFVTEVMTRAQASGGDKDLPVPQGHLPLVDLLNDPEYHHLKLQGKVTPEEARKDYFHRFIEPTSSYKRLGFAARRKVFDDIMAIPEPESGEPLAKWAESGAMNPTIAQRALGAVTPGKTAEDFAQTATARERSGESERLGLRLGKPGFTALASAANTGLFGLPKASTEAVFGRGSYPHRPGFGGALEEAVGSLAGFILGGPVKGAGKAGGWLAGKALARLPQALKVGKGAQAVQKLLTDSASLSAAFAAASAGDQAAQETLQDAMGVGLKVAGEGAAVGGVFGVSNLVGDTALLRVLINNAALSPEDINYLEAVTRGQQEWDEERGAQALFNIGLNTFFGIKGEGKRAPAQAAALEPAPTGFTEAGMGRKPGPGEGLGPFGRDVSGFVRPRNVPAPLAGDLRGPLARPATPFRPAGEAAPLAPAARSGLLPPPRATRPEISRPVPSQEPAAAGIDAKPKVRTVESPEGGVMVLREIAHRPGMEPGFLIVSVHVPEKERGKGVGQRLYLEALDRYGVLYSDMTMSDSARRARAALVRKGLAVEEPVTTPGEAALLLRKPPVPTQEPAQRLATPFLRPAAAGEGIADRRAAEAPTEAPKPPETQGSGLSSLGGIAGAMGSTIAPARQEWNKGQPFYHGHRGEAMSELSPADLGPGSRSRNYYGPGFYLTESPVEAGEYAKHGTTRGYISPAAKVLDMEAPVPDALLKSWAKALGTTPEALGGVLPKRTYEAYVAVEKMLRDYVGEPDRQVAFERASALGSAAVRDAGFDGITDRSAKGRHVILFDPKRHLLSAPAAKPRRAGDRRALTLGPPAEAPTAAKEPWEMTREERIAAEKERERRVADEMERDLEAGVFPRKGAGQYDREMSEADARAAFAADVERAKQPKPDWWYQEDVAGAEPLPGGQRSLHYREIEDALRAGKPVPPEVLADYPDINAKDLMVEAELGLEASKFIGPELKLEADLRKAQEASEPEAPTEPEQLSLWQEIEQIAREADEQISFMGTGPVFSLIRALGRAGRRQRMRMGDWWERRVYDRIHERAEGSRVVGPVMRAFDPLSGMSEQQKGNYLRLRGQFAGGRARAERTGFRAERAISAIVKKYGPQAGKVAKDYLEARPGDPNLTSDQQQALRAVDANPDIFGDLPAIKRTIHKMGSAAVRRGLLDQAQFDRLEWAYLPRILLRQPLGRKGRSVQSLGTGKGLDLNWTKRRRRMTEEELLASGTVDDAAYLASRAIIIEMSDILGADFYNRLSDASLGLVDPTTVVDWHGRRVSRTHFQQMMNWADENLAEAKDSGDPVAIKDAEDLLKEMKLARDANLVRWEGKRYTLRRFAEMIEKSRESLRLTPDPAERARREAAIERMEAIYEQAAPADYDYREWQEIPNDDKFGPGRGLVVHSSVADDIIGDYKVLFGKDELQGFNDFLVEMTRVFKRHMVTMNPPAQARNAVGNAILLDMAGTSVYRQPELFGRVGREIKNNGRVWNAMRARGLEGATFSHAEVGRLNRLYWKMLGKKSKMWRAMSMYVDLADWASERYQQAEVVFKMMRVLDRMDAWEIRTGRKARLLPKGEWEALMDELVTDAHKTLFQYDMPKRWVRRLRNAPLGAPFASFNYFVTSRFAEQSLKAPHRMLKWYLIPLLAAPAMFALYDISKEEYDAVQKLRADFIQEKGHAWMIPYRDSDGNWRTIDIGYFLPWGGIVEIAAKLAKGDVGGAIFEGLGIGGPAGEALSAMKTGVDPYTQRPIIRDEDEGRSFYWKSVRWGLYLMQMLAPPFLTEHGALADVLNAVRESMMEPEDLALKQAQRLRVSRGVPEAAARLGGVNIYKHNPVLDYEYRVMVLKGRMADLQRGIRRESGVDGDEDALQFYREQMERVMEEVEELNKLRESAKLYDRAEQFMERLPQ